MDDINDTYKLLYNTAREILYMPEYGRNVQKMVNYVKSIEDPVKREEQARAVVEVMEILNPKANNQENYEQTLWDHMHIISGFDLDVNSPYPKPTVEELMEPPVKIPIKKKPIKANHYGRNIESIIDLIAEKEDGEVKTEMIRSLAVYMRQQYLIWNKDTVADSTIYKDIERLSDYRIKVPAELEQIKLSGDSNFSRPSSTSNRNGRNHRTKNNRGRNNGNKKQRK